MLSLPSFSPSLVTKGPPAEGPCHPQCSVSWCHDCGNMRQMCSRSKKAMKSLRQSGKLASVQGAKLKGGPGRTWILGKGNERLCPLRQCPQASLMIALLVYSPICGEAREPLPAQLSLVGYPKRCVVIKSRAKVLHVRLNDGQRPLVAAVGPGACPLAGGPGAVQP